MATQNQIQAIAAAMHALRNDWPARSLATFLEKHFADRPFADLAVAAVIVALDERTKTPQLLLEHGRWWEAAYVARGDGSTDTSSNAPRCEKSGHGGYLAHNCGACKADTYAEAAKNAPRRDEKREGTPPPPEVVKLLAAARRRAKQATPASEVPDDAA